MSESTLITQRFKEFDGSKEYKSDLQSSLFGVMKEGDFFKLKRNKVMIKNTTSNTKDKFIILNVFQNGNDALFYCCPVCNDKKIVESLTEGFNSQSMKHCLHSDVCQILLGTPPG